MTSKGRFRLEREFLGVAWAKLRRFALRCKPEQPPHARFRGAGPCHKPRKAAERRWPRFGADPDQQPIRAMLPKGSPQSPDGLTAAANPGWRIGQQLQAAK